MERPIDYFEQELVVSGNGFWRLFQRTSPQRLIALSMNYRSQGYS
jgi:hypothetical protein